MNINKCTKAQLIALLIEAQGNSDSKPAYKELEPGRLMFRRDPAVKMDSREKNPVWGYIHIPEGVSGNVRFAAWTNKDADNNVIPGQFHGELDTQ